MGLLADCTRTAFSLLLQIPLGNKRRRMRGFESVARVSYRPDGPWRPFREYFDCSAFTCCRRGDFLVGGFDAGRRVLRQTPRKLVWGFFAAVDRAIVGGLHGLRLSASHPTDFARSHYGVAGIFLRRRVCFVITRLFLATLAESKQLSTPEAGKRAVEARNSEIRSTPSRLELILDNIGAGILVANDGGIIEILNPAAERLFGFNKA